MHEQGLIEKIHRLPPEKQAEVEDFVDFLNLRDENRRLTQAAAGLSEEAFRQVWDNEADSAYDQL
ncbi:MAG: toxin-antitoxin system, antitoxin component, Xre family protein [Acidobacteriota bacterium]